MPPTVDLLSPSGHQFDVSASDSNYRSMLKQGLLSLSAQKSQISQKSNFTREMENLLPPPDLMGFSESRDPRPQKVNNYNA